MWASFPVLARDVSGGYINKSLGYLVNGNGGSRDNAWCRTATVFLPGILRFAAHGLLPDMQIIGGVLSRNSHTSTSSPTSR